MRYVGEGVAVVVADSRYLAEDALELIEVEYEPLPPVTDPERALADGSPLVHEALESNCAYERTFDFGDVERDFAEANLVVRDRLRWHRSGGQPLETVGAIAEYDPGTGSFTIDTNTLSFTSYLFMAANTLKVPANKLDIRPVPGRRQLRLQAVRQQAGRDRRHVCASPGGRWSTWRTGSTTSRTAITTAPDPRSTTSSSP